MCEGKAVCAATIRVSLGYLEVICTVWCLASCCCAAWFLLRVLGLQVPFFATHETKRKRGYGRALVEAIEEV